VWQQLASLRSALEEERRQRESDSQRSAQLVSDRDAEVVHLSTQLSQLQLQLKDALAKVGAA
jgi:hypothetical protein